MILIKNKDTGPRVVLAQVLLNRRLEKGKKLVVDGIWGKKTNAAVGDTQDALKLKRGPIEALTIEKLLAGTSLKIVDSVDMTTDSGNAGDLEELRNAGGHPIAQCDAEAPETVDDAVGQVVKNIKTFANGRGSIVLLRFHGHGHRGQWLTTCVGDPLHVKDEDEAKYMQMAKGTGYISLANFSQLESTLAELTPLFAKFGSVEHHGCKIGTNKKLLKKLADLWGVPVSGGVQDQYGGHNGSTFVYEGRTYTAFPKGITLKAWGKSVAEPDTEPKTPAPIPPTPKMPPQKAPVPRAPRDASNRVAIGR